MERRLKAAASGPVQTPMTTITITNCEPAWPGGKGARLVSGRTQVRLPASAHLSLQNFKNCDLWTLSRDFALRNLFTKH